MLANGGKHWATAPMGNTICKQPPNPAPADEKGTAVGRYRSPDRRESAYRRVGQWRGGYRAPRRSPKRACARARAPALRRGQRSGRKSLSQPQGAIRVKAMMTRQKAACKDMKKAAACLCASPARTSGGRFRIPPARRAEMAINNRGQSETRGKTTERRARAPTGGEGAKGDGGGCRAVRRTRVAS